eukprot:jgi/Botrbrau1/23031/Bobra.136_1s0021.1
MSSAIGPLGMHFTLGMQIVGILYQPFGYCTNRCATVPSVGAVMHGQMFGDRFMYVKSRWDSQPWIGYEHDQKHHAP